MKKQEFTGAIALTLGILKGCYYMNMDWETDSKLCIGNACGVDISETLSYNMIDTSIDYIAFKLFISGLTGEHSSVAIVKGANANKLFADFLSRQTN